LWVAAKIIDGSLAVDLQCFDAIWEKLWALELYAPLKRSNEKLRATENEINDN
jgi:hypothetical protein